MTLHFVKIMYDIVINKHPFLIYRAYSSQPYMKTPTLLYNNIRNAIIVFALAFFLLACGGGNSNSGGGSVADNNSAANTIEPMVIGGNGSINPAVPGTQVTGPNLNGFWRGEFSRDSGGREAVSATIRHVGDVVVIETSRRPGIAKKFVGTIRSTGRMFMIDQFDSEDWTTLFGPASSNSITLADFVFAGSSMVDTNTLRLQR